MLSGLVTIPEVIWTSLGFVGLIISIAIVRYYISNESVITEFDPQAMVKQNRIHMRGEIRTLTLHSFILLVGVNQLLSLNVNPNIWSPGTIMILAIQGFLIFGSLDVWWSLRRLLQ